VFDSITETAEARGALYILTAALIGSMIMALLANFY
jgi:hypothetical protein